MRPVEVAHRGLLVAGPVLLAIVLSGCVFSREITQMKRQIERDMPEAEFDRDLVLNIGPAGLRFLGWTIGLSSDKDADEIKRHLSYVDRVKIGVFDTKRLPQDWSARVTVVEELEKTGWALAARRASEDELFGILYRERRGRIRDIYAVRIDSDELVLARISGDLQGLLDYAVENTDGFGSMIRP